MRQLELAVSTLDAEGMSRTAHSLKSSSANVGAQHLANLLARMENYGTERDFTDSRNILAEIRNAYQQATDQIRIMIA